MEPIIKLENIYQKFDDNIILDDININIYPGEIVSIIDLQVQENQLFYFL